MIQARLQKEKNLGPKEEVLFKTKKPVTCNLKIVSFVFG
jgi:hypothetical protein